MPSSRDPLEGSLTEAPDSIEVSEWAGGIPQVGGVAPRARVGRRWVGALWIVPVLGVLAIIGVAAAQELRTTAGVQGFIADYPGQTMSPPTDFTGFPWWLRWQHFFNLFFLLFIIRGGLQILVAHPRLYWNRHSTPGTEWLRFQKPVPIDRIWTAKQDSIKLPGWIGIPGLRHSMGLGRWWHFSFDLLWLLNGVIFLVLLFATAQWQRIVPTSFDVFPQALSTLIQYLSLDWPSNESWTAYNALQQLAYFITVFIAAPLALITGLMQSPAIANRVKFAGRALNRQAARSLHFLVLMWMLGFILIHTALVWTTGLLENLNHITVGTNSTSWTGFWVYLVAIGLVIVASSLATPFTLRHPRVVQRVGRRIVGPLKALLEHVDPRAGEYTEQDISPHFWPNGMQPASEEYKALLAGEFTEFKLRIDGLVEKPQELSLEELKAIGRQEQITQHFCIQGWSGVAKWGGVPIREICALVKPEPEARYVAFYSFGEGAEGGVYYDVHKLEHMYNELTILAYEMNGEPLSIVYGAPLRLRNEVELGFKQVKWIRAVEFVADFADLGAGEGGYNEDHEFFGYRMPI